MIKILAGTIKHMTPFSRTVERVTDGQLSLCHAICNRLMCHYITCHVKASDTVCYVISHQQIS